MELFWNSIYVSISLGLCGLMTFYLAMIRRKHTKEIESLKERSKRQKIVIDALKRDLAAKERDFFDNHVPTIANRILGPPENIISFAKKDEEIYWNSQQDEKEQQIRSLKDKEIVLSQQLEQLDRVNAEVNSHVKKLEEEKRDLEGQLKVLQRQLEEKTALWEETQAKRNSHKKRDTEEEKRKKYFQEAVKELLTTERDYIYDLELIQEVFANPLVKIIDQQEWEAIFSNLQEILHLNREISKDMEKIDLKSDVEATQILAETFGKYAEFFKMYSMYCAKQSVAMEVVQKLQKSNKNFANFLKTTKNHKTRQLPLESFLIIPIQRICKYPLLLKEILKYAESTNPFKANLKAVQSKVTAVVAEIDQRKETLERVAKVREISENLEGAEGRLTLVQPNRTFVAEDTIGSILPSGKISKVQVVAFNDMLLFTKVAPAAAIWKRNVYKYRAHAFYDQIIMKDLPDTDKMSNAFELFDVEHKATFTLFSKSKEEKQEWVERITQGQVSCEKQAVKTSPNRKESSVAMSYLVQKAGDLEKLHKNSWKKRWFVVKDGVLFRYDSPGGKQMGKFVLQPDCTIEEYQPEKMKCCFEIKQGNKSLVLRAIDEQDMHEWLNAILKHKFLSDSSIEKHVEPVEGSKAELKPSFRVKATT